MARSNRPTAAPKKRDRSQKSPAEQAAQLARKKLYAAIMSGQDTTTLCCLADLALDARAIAATIEPEWFSIEQLSKRYGVSANTLKSWGIPRHKFGNSIRYSRSDVLRFERENRVNPDADG